MADRAGEEEFDRLADTIYEAMPEGQLYEAMADNVASAVIAADWVSPGRAKAREAAVRREVLLEAAEEVENDGGYGYGGWVQGDLHSAAYRLRVLAEEEDDG